MQLLTIAIPKLEEMQKDGEEGRKKIAEYTRYVTVALALMESIAMGIGFGTQGILVNYNAGSVRIAQPILITINIKKVNKSRDLISLILNAFWSVFNIKSPHRFHQELRFFLLHSKTRL